MKGPCGPSRNILDYLPVVNQRGLIVPKVHLQSHSFRRIHEGLDGRFYDSAPAQFNEHAVADFVFRHGCGILHHAMPDSNLATLRLTAEESKI